MGSSNYPCLELDFLKAVQEATRMFGVQFDPEILKGDLKICDIPGFDSLNIITMALQLEKWANLSSGKLHLRPDMTLQEVFCLLARSRTNV